MKIFLRLKVLHENCLTFPTELDVSPLAFFKKLLTAFLFSELKF